MELLALVFVVVVVVVVIVVVVVVAAAAVYLFDVAFAAVKLRLNFDRSYMASVSIFKNFGSVCQIGYWFVIIYGTRWVFFLLDFLLLVCFVFPFILFVLFFKSIYT